MIPRPSPRPITRAPAPRPRYVPAGPGRVLAAIRPWRHLMKPGSAEILAFVEWADLQAERDDRRLQDEVVARLGRPETARHLVEKFSVHSRVGDPPLGDPGPMPLVPLWSPPR